MFASSASASSFALSPPNSASLGNSASTASTASTTNAVNSSKEPPVILRELPDEVVGERIMLRPFRVTDGPAVYEAVDESRETLFPWLPWAISTYDLQEAQAYVRRALSRWITREELPLGIWRREDGRFLGGAGLLRIKWDVPAFEIGYWLRRSEEGKGYMTETVTLLARLCFETLRANRLEIRCDAGNTRSAAVPRRLGFVHEATLRNEERSTTGELRDTFIFAITPDDYNRLFAR